MRGWFAAAATAIVLAAASPVQAQTQTQTQTPTAAHVELAREVVAVSGSAQTLRQTMADLAPQMADQIVERGVSREYATRFVTIFMEEFAAEEPRLLEIIATAYVQAFSEQELRDLIAFYRTPSGQAFVRRTPELLQTMTRVGELVGREAATRAVARLQAEEPRRPENP